MKETSNLDRSVPMTTRRALGSLVVLGLCLSACTGVITLDTSSPPVVTYAPAGGAPAPNVAAITRIASEGMVDVEVTVGAPPSVRLSCAAELAPHVHIEGQGDLLRIWTDPNLVGLHSGRCVALIGSPRLLSFEVSGSGDAHIHGPAAELSQAATSGSGDILIDELPAPTVRLASSGSGDINAHGLRAQTLEITANGSGDVHVLGASDRLQITCTGSGDIDARGLGAADVEAHSSGSGDVSVQASQRASVDTSGSGDIVVRGNPAQRSGNHEGSGSVTFE
ncbi:MAG: head GIN domain-containing protein [Byssovorax sp.]